ncbi:uncharacterized protein PgNI_00847 [Pyricularia grisea]|uniref:Catalase n=1 Tax=Pyricularia grisea TaxID=148305 RepID=A0A6P8BFM5_PYRGI|nr:uncharacterized protein PgNI_00847 [Pyricularia grisea]TLD15434.1 hypothetical protein PgNI_00847 [Pyricularia grisea]
MAPSSIIGLWASLTWIAQAGCPYADPAALRPRGEHKEDYLAQFSVDDQDKFLTSDVGGPIGDQRSLKAGARGSTLLEDFVFRQKITHFDHERVPERAVHARGAGAHGTFTSFGDFSNITSASFLNSAGKQTPVFVRFSTVAGSRGSADSARDVHGFATRFYTDEGNFDIVGNNVPVFFIQDAIQFPDLVHAVKPSPDKEIPTAATAHDSAWDFFSQQSSSLHALFWAMSGYGIPRSYRHMDGFGVHTFRMVTDDGESKLVKFHFKTKQGKASLVWEEAQVLSGKNPDFHRQDLWDAIEAGHGPEWEFGVQVVNEEDALRFGFDMLDPTKILPEDLVPVHPLGLLKLDRNPVNYFAETEQIMASRIGHLRPQTSFQPGHLVRGIDFTEDPLLQGRVFSYLDTQLNRHNGPNFEQLPINRPRVSVHNNNRDGAGQNFIHKNIHPYTPSALNEFPKQASNDQGRGFMTAPRRRTQDAALVRELSETFDDHWTQPRLFWNSITPAEQQILVNAIRFETSNILNMHVRQNVLQQLNRISDELARRVAQALGMEAPVPEPAFYHENTTVGLSIFGNKLPTIKTLRVAVLASTANGASLAQAADLKARFMEDGVIVSVLGEIQAEGVDITYSQSDATVFDGIIVAGGAEGLVAKDAPPSALFPIGRPQQLVVDSFRWGKPIGLAAASDDSANILSSLGATGAGVFSGDGLDVLVNDFKEGLSTYKFIERFPTDS